MAKDGKSTVAQRPDSTAQVVRLGALLRASRADRFTVEELAERAGLSAGLISQIERGIGNPSFATLMRLSQALELPLAAMFSGPDSGESQMLVRKDERKRMASPGDGVVHEMLVPNSNRRLGLISTTLPPGFSNEDSPYSHQGEEIVLLVHGRLHADIGGREFDLEAGDTLSFEADLPHAWVNATARPVTMLAISTPSSSTVLH